MAFRHIPGNSQYQYDQSPPDPGVGHPLRALWQKSENGIRTEHGQSTYVRCHRVGSNEADPNDPHVHGEISKSYWDLRSSVSSYGVLALEPKLILDFKESVFDTNGTASTFDASITHSASSNATMTDSDGLLKWRPHNLMTYSQDFTNSNWVTNLTSVANATTAPDGTLTADKIIEGSGDTRGRSQQSVAVAGRTIAVYAKAAEWDHVALAVTNGSGYWSVATFNLTSGTLAGGVQYGTVGYVGNPTITSVGDGWYLCAVDITTQTGSSPWAAIMPFNQSGNPVNPSPALVGDGTSGIYVWGAHTFRSDLGGMVNNPDRGDSYVPTTTTPAYLSRRGHHIYNGDAWVNEGILHESEARTNICTYSNDFGNVAYLKWLPSNITVTPNSAISPDGTTNATKFDMASNGYTRKISGHVPSVGQTYTFSVWIKAGTASEVSTVLLFSGGGLGYTAVTHTLTNEWQRFTVTSTLASGTPDQVRARILATQAGTIFVYGAQMEEGATPSSYISADNVAVTRAAETLTVPAANLTYPTPVETTGTELVTNGTFDTDVSGWVAGSSSATSAAVSGEMHLTAGPANGRVVTGVPTIVGRFYQVSGVGRAISGNGGPGATLYLTNSGGGTIKGGIINYTATDAPLGLTFKATATTSYISAIVMGNGGNVSAFDNISVKEINPLSVSIQMDGKITYADQDEFSAHQFMRWRANGSDNISIVGGTNTGDGLRVLFQQVAGGVNDTIATGVVYNEGILVPFNLSSRQGSTFINGATDGTALTANTTPVALPDLSTTDLNLGYDFMGTIAQFRVWNEDLTDAGIVEATLPSTEPSLSLTFDGSETSFTVLDWSE